MMSWHQNNTPEILYDIDFDVEGSGILADNEETDRGPDHFGNQGVYGDPPTYQNQKSAHRRSKVGYPSRDLRSSGDDLGFGLSGHDGTSSEISTADSALREFQELEDHVLGGGVLKMMAANANDETDGEDRDEMSSERSTSREVASITMTTDRTLHQQLDGEAEESGTVIDEYEEGGEQSLTQRQLRDSADYEVEHISSSGQGGGGWMEEEEEEGGIDGDEQLLEFEDGIIWPVNNEEELEMVNQHGVMLHTQEDPIAIHDKLANLLGNTGSMPPFAPSVPTDLSVSSQKTSTGITDILEEQASDLDETDQSYPPQEQVKSVPPTDTIGAGAVGRYKKVSRGDPGVQAQKVPVPVDAVDLAPRSKSRGSTASNHSMDTVVKMRAETTATTPETATVIDRRPTSQQRSANEVLPTTAATRSSGSSVNRHAGSQRGDVPSSSVESPFDLDKRKRSRSREEVEEWVEQHHPLQLRDPTPKHSSSSRPHSGTTLAVQGLSDNLHLQLSSNGSRAGGPNVHMAASGARHSSIGSGSLRRHNHGHQSQHHRRHATDSMSSAESDDQQSTSMRSSTRSETKASLEQKLKQELAVRKQQDDYIHQLQDYYDRLLSKHALAEVTIDQLRLGAKVNVDVNLLKRMGTGHQSRSTTTPQVGDQRRVSVTSMLDQQQHQQIGRTSAPVGDSGPAPVAAFRGAGGNKKGADVPFSSGEGSWSGSNASPFRLLPQSPSQHHQTPISDTTEQTTPDTARLNFKHRLSGVQERLESLARLADNYYSAEEQERLASGIRGDFDRLQRDYQQAKERWTGDDWRSQQDSADGFDPERTLEGDLFQLGMRLDEVEENVRTNLRTTKRRTPFHAGPPTSTAASAPVVISGSSGGGVGGPASPPERDTPVSNGVGPEAMQQQQREVGPGVGSSLVGSDWASGAGRPLSVASGDAAPDPQLADKVSEMEERYLQLMGRYNQVKRLSQTPARDRQIDSLMGRLREIARDAHGRSEVINTPHDLEQQFRLDEETRQLNAELEMAEFEQDEDGHQSSLRPSSGLSRPSQGGITSAGGSGVESRQPSRTSLNQFNDSVVGGATGGGSGTGSRYQQGRKRSTGGGSSIGGDTDLSAPANSAHQSDIVLAKQQQSPFQSPGHLHSRLSDSGIYRTDSGSRMENSRGEGAKLQKGRQPQSKGASDFTDLGESQEVTSGDSRRSLRGTRGGGKLPLRASTPRQGQRGSAATSLDTRGGASSGGDRLLGLEEEVRKLREQLAGAGSEASLGDQSLLFNLDQYDPDVGPRGRPPKGRDPSGVGGVSSQRQRNGAASLDRRSGGTRSQSSLGSKSTLMSGRYPPPARVASMELLRRPSDPKSGPIQPSNRNLLPQSDDEEAGEGDHGYSSSGGESGLQRSRGRSREVAGRRGQPEPRRSRHRSRDHWSQTPRRESVDRGVGATRPGGSATDGPIPLDNPSDEDEDDLDLEDGEADAWADDVAYWNGVAFFPHRGPLPPSILRRKQRQQQKRPSTADQSESPTNEIAAGRRPRRQGLRRSAGGAGVIGSMPTLYSPHSMGGAATPTRWVGVPNVPCVNCRGSGMLADNMRMYRCHNGGPMRAIYYPAHLSRSCTITGPDQLPVRVYTPGAVRYDVRELDHPGGRSSYLHRSRGTVRSPHHRLSRSSSRSSGEDGGRSDVHLTSHLRSINRLTRKLKSEFKALIRRSSTGSPMVY